MNPYFHYEESEFSFDVPDPPENQFEYSEVGSGSFLPKLPVNEVVMSDQCDVYRISRTSFKEDYE